jgi:hypothetical protein
MLDVFWEIDNNPDTETPKGTDLNNPLKKGDCYGNPDHFTPGWQPG